jgi:thiopeptide-type bacteriocin biosynthesis protein
MPDRELAEQGSAPRWISAHLFFGEVFGDAGDDVLQHVVAPFVTRCRSTGRVARYFFIRYRQGGSHVRLRLLPARDAEREMIRDELVAHLRALDADLRVSDELPASTPEAPIDGVVRHLAWIDYEPEVERYGGARALVLAEALFEASSDAALALLRGRAPRGGSRLGPALAAELALLHAFAEDRTHAMDLAAQMASGLAGQLVADAAPGGRQRVYADGFARQADALTEHVQATWEGLEEEEAGGAAITRYHTELRRIRAQLADLCADGGVLWSGRPIRGFRTSASLLVPSYVHMMHNRLGIAMPEEPYLSYLIGRALQGTADRVIA